MKKWKKVIASILSLALVFSMEMTALAADDTATTGYTADTVAEIMEILNDPNAVSEGKITITLTEDITEPLSFVAQKYITITIEGNKHALSDVQISGTGEVILNADIVGNTYTAALILEGYTEGESNKDCEALFVKVNGNITGMNGKGQTGVSVDNAALDMIGNITGGNRSSQGSLSDGNGLNVISRGIVVVHGNVTGGSGVLTEKELAGSEGLGIAIDGSDGVCVSGVDSQARVYGDVIGGNGSSNGGNSAPDIDGNTSPVASRGGNGVTASDGGSAEISGTARGGAYAENTSYVNGGDGAIADGMGKGGRASVVLVYKDAIGGNGSGNYTMGGTGAVAMNGGQVEIDGDAVGGNGSLNETELNMEGNYSDGGDGIYVQDPGSEVSVKGNAVGGNAEGPLSDAGEGVSAWSGGTVSVKGNATGGNGEGGDLKIGRANGGSGVFASDEGTSVSLGGSAAGGNSTGASGGSGGDGAYVQNGAQVSVGKNLTGGSRIGTSDTEGDGGNGATVESSGSSLIVGGNVTGGDLIGSVGEAGEGLDLEGAVSVTVSGSVTGGASKEVAGSNYQTGYQKAGHAISVEYESTVTVTGNATGGNAEGAGAGGNAVFVLTLLPAEAENLTAGTITVNGTAMGGTGNAPGAAIFYSLSDMLAYDINETTESFRQEVTDADPEMFLMQISMISWQMEMSGLLNEQEAAEFSYNEISAKIYHAMSGLAIPDNIQDDDVLQKYIEDCQAEVQRQVAAGADEKTLTEKGWTEAAKIDAEFDHLYTTRMAGVDPKDYVKANTIQIAVLSDANGGKSIDSNLSSSHDEDSKNNDDSKNSVIPDTGDDTQFTMWLALCAAAFAVILIALKREKVN